MKVSNYGSNHPYATVRGWVSGDAAVGTATLSSISLIIISPTISADTDDWNPTGLATASVIRTDLTADWNLTGITAPPDDRLVILENIDTAFSLTLVHDATSTAANRFLCPDNTDLVMGPNTGVWLVYDLTSTRWRVIGGAGGGTIPAGTYVLTIEGGQETINALGSVTGAQSIDPTLGNWASFTMTGDTTATIAAPVGSGGADLVWWVTQDGTGGHDLTVAATGGTVTDDGTITPDTTAGVTVRYILERVPGTTNDWIRNIVGGSGSTSPLTTKGDLWGYDTADARVPVGTNGYLLNADSTDAQGVAYVSRASVVETAGHWEPLMDGGSPYAPLDDGTGTDWLFVWVP